MASFGCRNEEGIMTQRGWLTNETVIQLKLYGEKGLHIWKKKHKNKEFYIKVTPVKFDKHLGDSGFQSFSDDSQSMDLCATREKFKRWPLVEVAVSQLTRQLFF